ncbi:MAG: PDZ domain-containing protein [Bacteroidia bacterium]|nr:PDZ domain-containing protein [Bacteroidia bacterium]NNJ56270.1 M61 family metallopeptidase [Bacteroidia bacterium]
MSASAINYTVSFEKVKSHYVTVSIEFNPQGKNFIDFKVPVWTPGSYKVREFSNAFENVKAGNLDVDRINKNTWRIDTEGITGNVKLTYDVYCFTVSVRQSYADENYAYLHGVSAFGYLEGFADQQIVLKINPYKEWNNVEVALPQIKAMGFVFTCNNYDLLADSPIAIGNFDVTSYTSNNVPHQIVMIGTGNYDLEVVKEDFKKISDSQVELMGDHPCERYVHFVYNVGNGGGGLEHLNSQCSMINRWAYTNKEKYRKFLGLIAHEYFHLWNVKRIRPKELGPFDYDKENYTEMLWIAEGITSYYDDMTLYKLGMYSKEEYLKVISKQINRFENTPGKDVMTLAESSKLAWVKSYMPKAESVNTEISYYNKGMIAALLLDLEIRKSGTKSLDDVMRKLYADYYKNGNKGFTHQEFMDVCSKVAGRSLQKFFDNVVFSTKALDYLATFSEYGIDVKDKNSESCRSWSGIKSSNTKGTVVITSIAANSPAIAAGLSVNDEIIGLDGWKLSDNFENHDNHFTVNDTVGIVYSRDGKLHNTKLEYQKSPTMDFELSIVDGENKLLKNWLN